MRRTAAIALGALASGLLVFAARAAGAGTPSTSFPLYSAGERVDDLPLTAVLSRDDTARYVSFVYGDCTPTAEAGCAPPVEIQVWPACLRNLALYGGPAGTAAGARITVRGAPAALFDEGTRLELETGRSTVVVFAASTERVLGIARALRSLDGSVAPGRPLPRPERGEEGGPMGC